VKAGIRAALLTVGVALLYAKLRRERGRVERLAAAALESLLNAVDANDPETGRHVRRVAVYSLILADACGVTARGRRSIERVALYHDIGKIQHALFDITHTGIALSPADRELIVTHPERGAEVLAPLAVFYPDLGDGVLSHHERWDGTGYPNKLRGAQIPFASRIVAIADTFDAITHLRRYGHARTLDDALEVVAAERGKQFDPSLADVFLTPAVLGRIRRAMGRRVMSTVPGKRVAARLANRPWVPDVAFRWRHTTAAAPSSDPSL
jgi:putative two-component system response regulator